MNLELTDIDEDDLVECAELFVTTFKELPWNEKWATDDAFDRLASLLGCPNTISAKTISNGHIHGFLIGEVHRIAL